MDALVFLNTMRVGIIIILNLAPKVCLFSVLTFQGDFFMITKDNGIYFALTNNIKEFYAVYRSFKA